MDIISLIAKRQQLRIWTIAPIVAILLLGASSGTFRNYKGSVLAEQEKLYQIIPQMETTLNNAERMINQFATTQNGGVGSNDKLLAFFNQVAEKEQFNLESAGVKLNVVGVDQPIMELEASVSGEGSLPSIVKFIDTILSEEPMLNEREFQLNLQPKKQGSYSAKFVFNRMVLQP